MTEEQRLRDRIELLKGAIIGCKDHRQRETLMLRLLDTQDQLMTLTMLEEPRARWPRPLRAI